MSGNYMGVDVDSAHIEAHPPGFEASGLAEPTRMHALILGDPEGAGALVVEGNPILLEAWAYQVLVTIRNLDSKEAAGVAPPIPMVAPSEDGL